MSFLITIAALWINVVAGLHEENKVLLSFNITAGILMVLVLIKKMLEVG